MRRSPSKFASKLHAAPRLACVKPVASVHPEPGSNSSLYISISFVLILGADSSFLVFVPAPSRDIDGRLLHPDICSILGLMSSLYFSTKSLWNCFQRSLSCRLAGHPVPFSECKSTDFNFNGQIFCGIFFARMRPSRLRARGFSPWLQAVAARKLFFPFRRRGLQISALPVKRQSGSPDFSRFLPKNMFLGERPACLPRRGGGRGPFRPCPFNAVQKTFKKHGFRSFSVHFLFNAVQRVYGRTCIHPKDVRAYTLRTYVHRPFERTSIERLDVRAQMPCPYGLGCHGGKAREKAEIGLSESRRHSAQVSMQSR